MSETLLRPAARPVHAAEAAGQAADAAVEGRVRIRTHRRPADRDRRTGARREAERARPGAAGRHRLRQDLHHGQGDRGGAEADPDPGAEQDAGGAALRRDEELLPRQRGGIFRLLLRLLPAGGLRPAHRHLHREGRADQRADRPDAARRDAVAAGTQRRGRGRLGVLHLRYRLGRDLREDGGEAGGRRADRSRRAGQGAGRSAIPPQRRGVPARHVPAARRDRRYLPQPLRRPRLAGHAVRRRDRIDPRIRSADRREDRRTERDHGLRQQPLRDAAADADPGDPRHQGGAEGAAGRTERGGQAAGGGAAGPAHDVRHRNDGDDRVLQGDRELFPLSDRPQAGRSAADACSNTCRRTRC